MQKFNAFFSLSSLSLLALMSALPACDEPIEDEDFVMQDEDDGATERTGQIRLEDGTELTYAVRNGEAILDGDIILGDADELETSFRGAGSTVTPWGGLWPGGVVYYQIQPGFQAVGLQKAIHHWEGLTGIQFVNSTHPDGYVMIGNFGPGCTANVGRLTKQVSKLNMSPDCTNFRAWVHEIGHTIGLHHEHTRTDRDNHINILWQNIDPAYAKVAFQKYVKAGYKNGGVDLGPYDFKSVMGYDSRQATINPYDYNMFAYTRKDGTPITTKVKQGLSAGDIQGVGALYGVW